MADTWSRHAWLCSLPVAGITNRLFLPLDLVLYCEAFLTTYRTFITPEELIKKLQYRYPFWAPHPGSTPLTPQSLPEPGERGAFLPTQPSCRGPRGHGRQQRWRCAALLCRVLALGPGARLPLSLFAVCKGADETIRSAQNIGYCPMAVGLLGDSEEELGRIDMP